MVFPAVADGDHYEHKRLIYQLRQAGGVLDHSLAAHLESCSPDERCRSGACIHCGRELQSAAVQLIEQKIREPAQRERRDRMSAITIIPASGIAAPDELTIEVCHNTIRDLSTAIWRAGISPSVCGLDVSFNEDQERDIPPHWAAHGHVVYGDWLSRRQEDDLRAAVEASSLVRRRVRVDKLDGRANGRLYPVKPDRARKVSYIDYTKVERKPFRNTHRRDPRPWQAVALAQVEHELGLLGRLIITGIPDNAVREALRGFYWPQDGP